MADGRAVCLPAPPAVTLRPEDGNARAAVLEHSVFQLPVFGVVVAQSGAVQQHEMAARCGASPGRLQTDCSWRESRPEARAPGSAPCVISGAAISLRNIGRTRGRPASPGGYRVRKPDRGGRRRSDLAAQHWAYRAADGLLCSADTASEGPIVASADDKGTPASWLAASMA